MEDIEEGQSSNTNDTRKTELELYKAALRNDWEKAESIYKRPGIEYGATITARGETALHIAALAGHTDFVQNLVEKMGEADTILPMKPRETNQQMEPTNQKEKSTNTAFHCAAISGDVKAAKAIATKPNLQYFATAKGSGDCLPIYMAALKGNKEMVRYLYKDTVSLLEEPNPAHDLKLRFKNLLINLIKADIYDVALNMAKELLKRSISCEKWEEGALHQLAQKPLNSVGFLDICFSPLLQRHLAEKRLMNKCLRELVELLWNSLISDEKKVQELIYRPDENVILEAAKHGNFKFLSILIASYPHVLFSHDHNEYTIFHHAILHRHVEIFQLIRIGSVKTIVTTFRDKGGKNMLHLAGKLAPPNRLNIVRGAALQLQRELLWFEEVKKVMEPHEVNRKISSLDILLQSIEDMKKLLGRSDLKIFQRLLKKLENIRTASKVLVEQHDGALFLFEELKKVLEQYKSRVDNISAEDYTKLLLQFKEIETFMGQHEIMEECTPQEVFAKEHKELMAQGEKWMRDTANSCMVVSALITTIAFAAAITIPGGNADNGYPQFVSEIFFKTFAIADSVSLVSSATSLLSFLSVLTSRYTIDDFHRSLPKKLFIGLITLFMSIVAMMVAFLMSIFIIFEDRPKLLAVVISSVSSVPIILFIWQHFRLLYDVAYSTFTPCLLFKSRGDPNLLLKEE